MLKSFENLHNSKIITIFVYQKKDREVEVKFWSIVSDMAFFIMLISVNLLIIFNKEKWQNICIIQKLYVILQCKT